MLGFAAAASCGGSTTATEHHPDVVAADLPGEAAEAICANLGDCCEAHGRSPDGDRCRQNIIAYFASSEWDVVQGRIPASGQCLDSLAAWARSCELAFSGTGGGCRDARANLYANRKTRGQACDATCTITRGFGCFFVPPRDSSLPEPPASNGCFTNDGLYCDPTSQICETRRETGAPCDERSACSSDACVQGTCVPRGSEGAACSQSVGCEPGLYCADSSGPCDASGEPSGDCTCIEERRVGDPCAGEAIACPFDCVNGKCAPEAPPIGDGTLDMICRPAP